MRITGKIFLAVLLVICFSCEDQGLIVKCPDCTADEPVKTDLIVKLDDAYSGFRTVVNVYEGNLEDSILYRSNTVTGFNTYIIGDVSLNKKYTVTATYYIHDDYYIAIDSATPRVRFDKTKCDDPCYFVYDRDLDLRLKYTK